jgi:hypothetical protein
MAFPRPPGVYFERSDSPEWAVDEARLDIAGFVGIAERGPLHKPVRIQNVTQFFTRFGRARLDYAHLPDAVQGFFANGGRTAWIVRVGRPVELCDHASLFLVNANGQIVFRVRAKDPGVGGGVISVQVLPGVQNRFHLAVSVVAESGKRETQEVWRDLQSNKVIPKSSQPNDRYAARVVNGWNGVDPPEIEKPDATTVTGSALIVIEELPDPAVGVVAGVLTPESHEERTRLTGEAPFVTGGVLGWDSDFSPLHRRSVLDRLELDHFIGNDKPEFGLSALEQIPEVSIVAIPDLVWRSTPFRRASMPVNPCDPDADSVTAEEPSERRIELSASDLQLGQSQMLAHCARLKNRFAILDAPNDSDPVRVQHWAEQLRSAAGQYGALYFPWIGVSTSSPGVHWMPPSGHVAGLYARVDLASGVQKSPANEVLNEVQGVMYEVSEEAHGQLNVECVNVLKAGVRGIRVMGARTLVDPSDSELRPWRYVSVRRLLLMLERSLEMSAAWLVHADNRAERWRDVERVIRNFLRRQWQQGRLGGTTPEEAYSVECDESTNPWEDVERGRMTCVIGVQPPLPAEFVFVRLGDRGGSAGHWSFGGSSGTA